MSVVFPPYELSLSVLPSVGPLSPQVFPDSVFPFNSLPCAEPVGVTRNSMPARFDQMMLSLARYRLR